MVASATSPEDVVNLALIRMGYPMRVGSLYEGSKHAKHALDVYASTRDEMLRSTEPLFSEGNIALTLLKSAPPTGYVPPNTWNPATNPPYPWLYEYVYPIDCLKVRAIKQTNVFPINFAPKPYTYGIQNDNFLAPPAKVLLCNIPNAIMVYTRQVTDPTLWEADFVDALAAALGRRLGAVLIGKDAVQLEAQDEGASRATRCREHGVKHGNHSGRQAQGSGAQALQVGSFEARFAVGQQAVWRTGRAHQRDAAPLSAA